MKSFKNISKNKKAPIKWMSVFAVTFGCTLVISICCALFWLNTLDVFSDKSEILKPITNYQKISTSIIKDTNNNTIGEFYHRYQIFTPFNRIPRKLIEAVVATEDSRFFSHSGADIAAIGRAAIAYIKKEKVRQGASTITQQLVRHFSLNPEKTISRKVQEIFYALELERHSSKAKILEVYLNQLYLGNRSYGVAAAAKGYFSKKLSELTLNEMALIAGLYQSPSRFNPIRNPSLAHKRKKIVLKSMYREGYITKEQLIKLYNKKVVVKPDANRDNTKFPFFVDHVKQELNRIIPISEINKGIIVETTVDPEYQLMAEAAIANHSDLLNKAERYLHPTPINSQINEIEAAILVSEPKTGEIKAMVGGRNYNSSQFNRTTQSMRAAGSTIKPAIYITALERGYKWSDVLFISPISVGSYRPKNSGDHFHEETTMLKSFYESINTTAIELTQKVGLDPIIQLVSELGVKSPIKNEVGSVLGSSEVTMKDMNTMYSTFANMGTRVDLISIKKVLSRNGQVLYQSKNLPERSSNILSKQSSYLIHDGLNKVIKFGTARKAEPFEKIAAGKTGTSDGGRDNWFIGYTSELTTSVWVGVNETGHLTKMYGGARLALPIWQDFMNKSLKKQRPKPFIAPKGVVTHSINPRFGYIQDGGINMYFYEGREPDSKNTNSELEKLNTKSSYRKLF